MLIVRARAKLNLGLAITRRREDGWHDVDSLVVPIDWHDLVGVRILPGKGGAVVRVTGPRADAVPKGSENLAHRAALALGAIFPTPMDVEVWLEKRLPSAAGLGGGSADAAAVLRAGIASAPRLGAPLDIEKVAAAAIALGSDVPVLLANRAMRVRGRGEIVEPVAVSTTWVVVAVAGASSTPAAYAELRADEMGGSPRIDRLCASAGTPTLDLDACGSALEAAAVRSNGALGAGLARLRADAGERWFLTGSGGAAFCVVAGRRQAADLTYSCRQLGMEARACLTGG